MEGAAARRGKATGPTRALALAVGLAALAALAPQRAMLQHTDVEGGGELRMARKRAALRAVLGFYAEYAGAQLAGSQYDTNAIGEAWGGAAMGHWVDRPSAADRAERLEDELKAMRIGRRSASHPRRLAMQERRLARQQELDSRPPRHENAMLHWARPIEDRPRVFGKRARGHDGGGPRHRRGAAQGDAPQADGGEERVRRTRSGRGVRTSRIFCARAPGSPLRGSRGGRGGCSWLVEICLDTPGPPWPGWPNNQAPGPFFVAKHAPSTTRPAPTACGQLAEGAARPPRRRSGRGIWGKTRRAVSISQAPTGEKGRPGLGSLRLTARPPGCLGWQRSGGGGGESPPSPVALAAAGIRLRQAAAGIRFKAAARADVEGRDASTGG
ncbi:unnamed protein product [Prorocentrum cordatum]|uniref:Uncharacterized protein n=1 Tax=Prorocentrum cordatum TaxID=2364126 RepID=A0ABN9UPX6_9DINO|nr:unnamed protein product [Polarella glacialis]